MAKFEDVCRSGNIGKDFLDNEREQQYKEMENRPEEKYYGAFLEDLKYGNGGTMVLMGVGHSEEEAGINAWENTNKMCDEFEISEITAKRFWEFLK